MSRSRQIVFGFWVALVASLLITYSQNPEWWTPERVVSLLQAFEGPVMLAYLVLSVIRPFTLLPSTVLIVVGTVLFPSEPIFVGLTSLAGATVSAAVIYFFFEYLGLAEMFQRSDAERVKWLKRQIQRKGFWIVLAWSGFPFLPSDLIYYVAGTLKMRLLVFLSAVAIGKIPLVVLYVLLGMQLFA